MKSLRDVLTLSTDYLKNKGQENPRHLAERLLASFFNMQRIQLYVDFERPVNDKELNDLRQRLARLGKGEPIQYIEGEIEFALCRFKVDKRALIPRPETEELVEKIIAHLQTKETLKGRTFLDLCSGTGAIGICIKKKFPDLTVILSDISPDAGALAKENAAMNGVEVQQLIGDLFKPISQKIDILACNPPYISQKEYDALDPSVKSFEPKLALCAGSSGLEFYERIAKECPHILHPNASLFLEIGYNQGPEVQKIFEKALHRPVILEKDLSGHDRFIII